MPSGAFHERSSPSRSVHPSDSSPRPSLPMQPARWLSGQWAKEQSLELARKALLELLPQGRQTADSYLFGVLNDQARLVGMLWIAANEQAGNY